MARSFDVRFLTSAVQCLHAQVYYNNVLSIPPLVVLVLLSGELYRLPGYRMMHSIEFQVRCMVRGIEF